MISLVFVAVVLLMLFGLAAVVFKRNMIKIVMGVSVMGSAVNLFLVALGYRAGGIAPIFTGAEGTVMVLPTPQALTLTSIVIGLAVTAMMLSLVMKIYGQQGSLDVRDRRLKG